MTSDFMFFAAWTTSALGCRFLTHNPPSPIDHLDLGATTEDDYKEGNNPQNDGHDSNH